MSQPVDPSVQTPSGIPLQPVYGPAQRAADPPPPGTYPFTRGNFASGYRGKTWTFRQYSGFGTAEESNRRYRYLLDQGGTGLSVALDLPTQCGYDSDDPEYGEEVGRVGVAVDTLADAEILFDGIPLDKISTSFTINGTAAILLAFYVAAAEKKGVPREKLTGTIQNDILKEYASRGTWIWPPEPSLRLIADTIEFCAAEVPRFNAISVAGAHFRDAGANAVQEMAFTLADGVTYCDTVVERGRMTIDKFAPQISFFFYTHGDFFEEIAKYRAGRRRWATIVRERYGATTDKASMFRFGCVAGGASLYAPQAQNNLVRVAYEAMAADIGCDLQLRGVEGNTPLMGDRHLLFQAVANLLDNALKFTPPAGQVLLTLTREGDWMQLDIEDNGPGIPTGDEDRVFDRLFRHDRTRQSQGYGLGLSLVRAIARLHGGDCKVVPHAGGALLRMRLPVAQRNSQR